MLRDPGVDIKKLPDLLARNATSNTWKDSRRIAPSGVATVIGPPFVTTLVNVSLGAPSRTAAAFKGVITAVRVD
jgi:hypothetical protein